MKDLGEAVYILGMKIYRDRSKRLLELSQSMHIDTILKWFSMKNFKRRFLPLRHDINLFKTICPTTSEEVQRMSRISYALAIESFIYAMLCTRPDIALTVSITSRYQANSDEEYWIAVKNILKYLRKIKDLLSIFGGGSELKAKGYTDLDFMTDVDDRKIISRCILLCNSDAVS